MVVRVSNSRNSSLQRASIVVRAISVSRRRSRAGTRPRNCKTFQVTYTVHPSRLAAVVTRLYNSYPVTIVKALPVTPQCHCSATTLAYDSVCILLLILVIMEVLGRARAVRPQRNRLSTLASWSHPQPHSLPPFKVLPKYLRCIIASLHHLGTRGII